MSDARGQGGTKSENSLPDNLQQRLEQYQSILLSFFHYDFFILVSCLRLHLAIYEGMDMRVLRNSSHFLLQSFQSVPIFYHKFNHTKNSRNLPISTIQAAIVTKIYYFLNTLIVQASHFNLQIKYPFFNFGMRIFLLFVQQSAPILPR